MPIRRLCPLALVFVLLASACRTPLPSAQKQMPLHGTGITQAQSQTLRDMRKVGEALFSWLSDVAETPSATGNPEAVTACVLKVLKSNKESGPLCDVYDLDRLPLISRQELTQLLVPHYIDVVPEKDGWGTPYEFRLDRKNLLNNSVMSMRSPGQNKAFSGHRYKLGSFPPAEADQDDLVWVDGFFIRWPEDGSKSIPPAAQYEAPALGSRRHLEQAGPAARAFGLPGSR